MGLQVGCALQRVTGTSGEQRQPQTEQNSVVTLLVGSVPQASCLQEAWEGAASCRPTVLGAACRTLGPGRDSSDWWQLLPSRWGISPSSYLGAPLVPDPVSKSVMPTLHLSLKSCSQRKTCLIFSIRRSSLTPPCL